MNVWDCEYYGRCLNTDKCYLCGPQQRLLKLPEPKWKSRAKKVKTTKSDLLRKDSWKNLEEVVREKLNQVPTIKEARRQLRSGGLWFAPGDVIDDVLLVECKERDLVDAEGRKYFSIKKAVLDKIIAEAQQMKRFPGLVFRYKGEEDVYAVMRFDDLVQLVHLLKAHVADYELLLQERDQLRAIVEELENQIGREKHAANS